MPLDNQTKQTLASMSWARLTWEERARQMPLLCAFGRIDRRNTVSIYHSKTITIKTQTLSQMEVVSYNVKQ